MIVSLIMGSLNKLCMLNTPTPAFVFMKKDLSARTGYLTMLTVDNCCESFYYCKSIKKQHTTSHNWISLRVDQH